MSDLRLIQIQFETDTWKREFYHMMDENAHLKTHLSLVLKNRSDKRFLAKAEMFQGCFIDFDDQILIFRNQIAGLNKLILKNSYGKEHGLSDETISESEKSLAFLRKKIALAQKNFNKLRMEFICYLVNV